MADTPAEAFTTGTATLEPPASTRPSTSEPDRLKPSTSPEERLDEWHRHAGESGEQIHEDMMRAREVLHTGTAADAVELANEDIGERAAAAAERWQSA
jgi:hypothetical protein